MVYYSNESLYHHGILGQKWGVRRYQNPDGSLTSAGRKRYGVKEKAINAKNSSISFVKTKKDAVVSKVKNMSPETKKKIVIGGAAATAAILAAYGGYKHLDNEAGKIKAGEQKAEDWLDIYSKNLNREFEETLKTYEWAEANNRKSNFPRTIESAADISKIIANERTEDEFDNKKYTPTKNNSPKEIYNAIKRNKNSGSVDEKISEGKKKIDQMFDEKHVR